MRLLVLLATTVALTACGTMQYQDTNAAVDANPVCATGTPQPGEPVPPWCQREQSASWSTERESQPIDFSGDESDD